MCETEQRTRPSRGTFLPPHVIKGVVGGVAAWGATAAASERSEGSEGSEASESKGVHACKHGACNRTDVSMYAGWGQ